MKQQRRAGISTNRYMLLVGIFISLSIIALGIDKLIPAGAVATADIDTFGPLVGAELLLALLASSPAPLLHGSTWRNAKPTTSGGYFGAHAPWRSSPNRSTTGW